MKKQIPIIQYVNDPRYKESIIYTEKKNGGKLIRYFNK